MCLPARGAADRAGKADHLVLQKEDSRHYVQSRSCLVVRCLVRSDVTQHLPSSAKHNLVALFFTRTMEGLPYRAIVCTNAGDILYGRDMLFTRTAVPESRAQT
jgi:hypothetical protein